jgi:peptide/nickel transport system ATP-binding protein
MALTATPLLEIQNLEVRYATEQRTVHAVRGVSLALQAGQTLGIVGESGSGKSTLAFAVMGYCGANGRVTGGRILFKGTDLASLPRREMRRLLGNRIAMVYQDPQKSLNPSIRVGEQIAEVLLRHERLPRRQASERTLRMLEAVHMPDPAGVARSYPHQLSGGMQQRVVIAAALICNPDLLIMDEPTSGLDVTTEAVILDLINELKSGFGSSILFITHNLGVVARICDRVAVMYAGEIVEANSVQGIYARQTHPYTADLLSCVPTLGQQSPRRQLRSIPGQLPRPGGYPAACIYAPRCSLAQARCSAERPALTSIAPGHDTACFFWPDVASRRLVEAGPGPGDGQRDTQPEVLLEVQGLHKTFDARRRQWLFFGPQVGREVKAVSGVSFDLMASETLAMVGESGCGKSTLARSLCGLEEPTSGRILFRSTDISVGARQRKPATRRAMQMVFQNPDSSLNPKHTLFQIIARPLTLFGLADPRRLRERVAELLETVRLDKSYLDRLPAELSGGEKQRVSIARAFAGDPSIIVCDEAVSSLDVSVQASILNLLTRLQREQGSAYFFISHDLGVIQYIADRILVMYLGYVVETGTVGQIFDPPYHPYTEALLSAVPVPDPRVKQKRIRLEGPVPSPDQPMPGCPFHTRCPRSLGEICRQTPPPWLEAGPGHRIRCHIPLEELRRAPSVMSGLPVTVEPDPAGRP